MCWWRVTNRFVDDLNGAREREMRSGASVVMSVASFSALSARLLPGID